MSIPSPLDDCTVLDLTEGGFNWCGKVLADFGADVIKVEPPGGSPTREVGPFVDGRPGPERSLFWAAYCVNKRSVVVDLTEPAELARFRRLADGADILIESFRPGHMRGLGLGYEDLSASNPGLVYTSVTPFGQTGPYSQYLASDMVTWSMGGMQYICGDADRPPVRVSAPQAELHAGGQAAVGTMAAYWHRQNTGQGQHIDVSAQTSVMWTLMNATPYPPLHGINLERNGAFRSTGRVEVRQVFRCADGHVTILMAPRTIRPLAEWMDGEEAAPRWFRQIEWDDWRVPSPDEDPDRIERFHDVQRLVEEFVATRTKDELYLRAIRHRMLIAPCNSVGDIARSPFSSKPGTSGPKSIIRRLGARLTHLGPFIKMSESPIRVSRPAPGVGEHSDEVLAGVKGPSQKSLGMLSPSPQSSPIKGEEDSITPSLGAMPFSGIRVLDFTWVGVGPITIKHLADFGADVIRIESVSRPDVLRNAAPFKDGVAGINRSQFSANYNTSKRGLGLNLASPEGRDLVRKIIREWKPDVIAESFTPRVMRGWGLAYSDVREMLPKVIYFSTCQQGQTGPHASYAGFGQLAGSLAGFYYVTGWPDRDPAGPYGAYSDFINPPNAAAAIVAALEFRRRTGKGQHLDLSQFECATHYLAPFIMEHLTNGSTLERRGNEDDHHAPHNVYRCADSERVYTGVGPSWIAISIADDRQWRALCKIMDRTYWIGDERFMTLDSRREYADLIDEEIGLWTRDKNARHLMDDLQKVGVPAGVVQNQADLWEDPQVVHREFFQWLDHSECGPMPYDGIVSHLSKTPGALRRPQALVGEHNGEILREILGMDGDAISDLVAAGVLETS